MNSMVRMAGVVALLVAGACAGQRSGVGERRSARVLGTEEIRASTAVNVYDMVQAIRPMWLRIRGTTSLQESGTVVVYVNRLLSGSAETLRQIRPDAVETMRYLDGVEATARYGPGHDSGVIEVSLIAGSSSVR